jgi:6-phosphogluconolactonase
MTNIRVFDSPDAVANAAADDLIAIAKATTGVCTIALSGGSTPKKLHAILAARGRDAAPWDRIALYFGDERGVPPDHADSNYRMAKETLIDPLKLTNVHRMEAERADRDRAADDYAKILPAAFDLVLLGMGPDGHTASLFPGTPAENEMNRRVVANPVKDSWRMTMTFPAISAARHVRFLVCGADKTAMLSNVLDGPPNVYPAQRVTSADLVWLCDKAARPQGHK